ncbi:MAG: hypothetical protein RIT32_240, partial [Actinomycetota bacterium]
MRYPTLLEAISPVTTSQVATGLFANLWLLIALPLLGAIVLLLGGNRTNSFGPYFAVLMPVASF